MAMAKVEHFETCVIGAGVVGCSIAYHLLKQGRQVLLLEQFPLPHTRGSSHGQTRIIRHAYAEKRYSQMMPESYRIWRELEEKTESKLLLESGLLVCSDNDDDFVSNNYKSLCDLNKDPLLLNESELKTRYPMILFEDNVNGVFEQGGGVLLANKCLESFMKMIREMNGVVRDQEAVIGIDHSITSQIKVTTTKASYSVGKLAITGGAYSTGLLKKVGVSAPLQATGVRICYWPIHDEKYLLTKGFPTIIHQLKNNEILYCIPSFEYPGLIKIWLHHGNKTQPQTRSIDIREKSKVIQKLKSYIKDHFNGISPDAAIVEECLYCDTPDSDFIVDYHPNNTNIVIATGFSGHGFKTSPVIGKIVAAMMTAQKVSYDISGLSLSRLDSFRSSL